MDRSTLDHLKSWIGRHEEAVDVVAAARVAALTATLDHDVPWPETGTLLPPLWHWVLCTPAVRQSQLGTDGHPQRGGFLPPVPLPRRLWAGGRFRFHQPLRVGDAVRRESRILSVEHKRGRSGELVFVVVGHEYHGPQGLAVSEEHDIVYREMPAPDAAPPAPVAAPVQHAWRRVVQPDDVLLFRYSALTFNGHRIHYDRRYATEVEGYPGLIVHGPLIATLLLDLLRQHLPAATLTQFEFRAVKPVFDTAPFAVCGQPADDQQSAKLWAQDAEGNLAMDATATIETRP